MAPLRCHGHDVALLIQCGGHDIAPLPIYHLKQNNGEHSFNHVGRSLALICAKKKKAIVKERAYAETEGRRVINNAKFPSQLYNNSNTTNHKRMQRKKALTHIN